MAWIRTPQFVEERASWIDNHHEELLYQRRRAELMRKRLWEEYNEEHGAGPNPYGERITASISVRIRKSDVLFEEWLPILAGVLFLPFAWLFGRSLYRRIMKKIPDELKAYPITPLALVAGVLMLAVAGVFWLLPDLSGMVAIMTPFLLAQIPGTFFFASLYGVLEGWLFLEESTAWLPQSTNPRTVEEDDRYGEAPSLLQADIEDIPPLFPIEQAKPKTPVMLPTLSSQFTFKRSNKK